MKLTKRQIPLLFRREGVGEDEAKPVDLPLYFVSSGVENKLLYLCKIIGILTLCSFPFGNEHFILKKHFIDCY